jgi:hypothetical protein
VPLLTNFFEMKNVLLLLSLVLALTVNAQAPDLKSQFPELIGTSETSEDLKTFTPCGYLQESNTFENGYASNVLFPNVVAEDFYIPAGETWDINQIKANFFTNNPTDATAMLIVFYEDNAGTVGNIIDTVTVNPSDWTTTVLGSAFGFDIHEFVFTLTTPYTLVAGSVDSTYWMSIQAVNTLATGDFYWETSTVSGYGNNGSSAPTTAGPFGVLGIENLVFELNKSYVSNMVLNECSPFSIVIGTNTYSTTGITSDTLISTSGCDSIINLDLTVNIVDVSISTAGFDVMADFAGATSYQWLDCDNSYAIIAGETSQVFTPSANGNYAVEVTNAGCTDTSSCMAFLAMTTEKELSTALTIYPNPTSGIVSVNGLSSVEGLKYLEITAATGAIIGRYDGILTELDLSEFADGIYFLNVAHEARSRS